MVEIPKNDQYSIKTASTADLYTIMAIEKMAFTMEIRESATVFLERLNVFSDGFFLLRKCKNTKMDPPIGYFCSEIWPKLPDNSIPFLLGHSIKESHRHNGNCLYISSIGLTPQFRGMRLGELLFMNAVQSICLQYPLITQLVLVVNESWAAARALYRRAGFSEYMRLPSFFPTKMETRTDGIGMCAAAELYRR